jgi:hypothetical protein
VASQKKGLLTVRMYEEDLLDFAAACRLRGGTMSSIVHQYAHKVIFEEKQKHSQGDFGKAMDFVIQEREEKAKSTIKKTKTKSNPKSGKTTKTGRLFFSPAWLFSLKNNSCKGIDIV